MYEYGPYRKIQKLNSNCPDSEKTGSGPGSCGGASGKGTSNTIDSDIKNSISNGIKAYEGKASREELRSNLGRSEVIDAMHERFGKGMDRLEFRSKYLAEMETAIRRAPVPPKTKTSAPNSNKSPVASKSPVLSDRDRLVKALPKGAKISDNEISWESSGDMRKENDVTDKIQGIADKLGWKVKDYKPHFKGDDDKMHIKNEYVSPDGLYSMQIDKSWSSVFSKDTMAKVKIRKMK